MKNFKNFCPWMARMALLGMILSAVGCSSWRNKDDEEFEYEDYEVPPLVQPETVPSFRYAKATPSGRLYPLNASKIGIAPMSEFVVGSDPAAFLRNHLTKSKKEGSPFLPYHFYIAPDGMVFEGLSLEYAGELGSRRMDEVVFVGILGNYDLPTAFPPPEQEKNMIQLCAWLCAQRSIDPSNIVPTSRLDPNTPKLGRNLMNWFGPTDLLRNRVREALAKSASDEAERKEKEKGFFSRMYGKKEHKAPDINEDF